LVALGTGRAVVPGDWPALEGDADEAALGVVVGFVLPHPTATAATNARNPPRTAVARLIRTPR
jgi:hypothetical protein